MNALEGEILVPDDYGSRFCRSLWDQRGQDVEVIAALNVALNVLAPHSKRKAWSAKARR